MPLFDLKKNLVFYGAYHRDPTNVAIHIACVPVLLGTGFIFGSNTPSLLTRATPTLLTRLSLPPNLTTLTALTYSTLYLALSPNLAGLSITPLILGLAALANKLTSSSYNRTRVNGVAAAVHVACWIAQFVGHARFERRKPALLDNLVQALGLAPLFVWYEVLFRGGLYKRLRGEMESGVEGEVEKMREGKGKGR